MDKLDEILQLVKTIDHTTKKASRELKIEMKDEMKTLKDDIKAEMRTFRTDIKSEFESTFVPQIGQKFELECEKIDTKFKLRFQGLHTRVESLEKDFGRLSYIQQKEEYEIRPGYRHIEPSGINKYGN